MIKLNKINLFFLLIVFVFLIISIGILLFNLILPQKGAPKKEPSVFPTLIPSTEPTLVLPTNAKIFSVIRNAPIQGPDIFYLPVQPVELTFSTPLEAGSLTYSVNPFVETVIKQGSIPTAVIISPTFSWKNGLTKIKIHKGNISLDGSILPSDFIYSLQTNLPPAPPEGENY